MQNNESRGLGGRGGIANPDEVGRRIARARTALGLTQAEFARRIDVGRNQLMHYEGGRHLTMRRLERIAAVTDRAVTWFLTGRKPGVESLAALSADPEIARIAKVFVPTFQTSNQRAMRELLAEAFGKLARALEALAGEIAAEEDDR